MDALENVKNNSTIEYVSNREREVLTLLQQGMTNQQNSQMLDISERTVKFHCANIYQKHRVNNRFELLVTLSHV